jgi:hypothetical protein
MVNLVRNGANRIHTESSLLRKGEGCTHYRDSKPVRYAVGFTKMQKMMFPQQYERFSNQLKGKFGRNPYFERRNGQHPMPPEEQQLILHYKQE